MTNGMWAAVFAFFAFWNGWVSWHDGTTLHAIMAGVGVGFMCHALYSAARKR